MAARTMASKKVKKDDSKIYFELTGIIVCFISLLVFLSILSPISFGKAGALLSVTGKKTFGYLILFIAPYFFYQGIFLILNRHFDVNFTRRKAGIVLFYFTLLSFIHLCYLKFTNLSLLQIAQTGLGGGYAGYGLSFIFITLFGKIGAVLFTLTLMVISQVLIFADFFSTFLQKIINFAKDKYFLLLEKKNEYLIKRKELKAKLLEEKQKKEGVLKLQQKKENEQKNNENIANENNQKILNAKKILETPLIENVSTEECNVIEETPDIKPEELIIDNPNEVLVPVEEIKNKKSKLKLVKFEEKKQLKLPPISLLDTIEIPQDRPRTVEEQKEKIIQTLKEFGVEARMIAVSTGPRITRFELQPATGVKVKEIVTLADDLALHLAAAPIRVEAPIPGKSAIGIEVPNKGRNIVPLKDLLEQVPNFNQLKSKIYFALGKDIAGTNQIADLTKMPHLLIAGATGSGKSVCINSVIASILFTAYPDEIKLLMIDPKRVELTLYNGIPHLLSPVIVDAKLASVALEVMIKEMEDRYDIFAERGVRNIQSFNEKFPEDKLPYLVIIIDELADLMFQSAAEVERNICRLAQLARATGIHLVIATQRPSVNVITGLIKANVPSRLSFAVASQTDSRTVLDMAGSEKLLGEGDMLFKPIEATKPMRIQGAFISENETKRLVDFWKAQAEPEYDARFENLEVLKQEKSQEQIDEEDELFKDAVEVILNVQQASASMLQRKLKIGYARAGRLMDQMEKRGVVGPSQGSKPREILVDFGYLKIL